MAVRRELRKAGALSLGQGVRVVPDVPVFADGMERAARLTNAAGGQAMTRHATGRAPEDAAGFEAMVCEDHAERVFAAPHHSPGSRP
ncbi:Chromate resistance protein ChrB [Streptomyces sp. NPDC059378]|uniref:Chromate resistance protein ChrB n=1 Tax=Streptomyces sp. NPDC059378 TaxID=3346815 RepID=UPI0036920458